MFIQGFSNIGAAYNAASRSSPSRQQVAPSASSGTDSFTLSDAAKTLMAGASADADTQDVQTRLDAIKAKPAIQRTSADSEYLSAHDQRFNEIQDKIKEAGSDSLNAADVDYLQKATGLVNTMAYLSPKERALYDDLVSNGNREAANAMMLVGMSRISMEGQQVTLPGGQSFDPTQTEVTADSTRNLFKHMFVDSSGGSNRAFDALAAALDQRQASQAS